MNKRLLFYVMRGEKMCFQHVLLNVLHAYKWGHDPLIIFEGQSVTMIPGLEKDQHPLYLECKQKGLIAGVCEACSKTLGVYDDVKASGLKLLSDMSGHASMSHYLSDKFEVIVM